MNSNITNDPWEQLCFTTKWYMDNFPPIDDYNYFMIKNENEKQYLTDLEFYGHHDYNDYDEDFLDEYNYTEYYEAEYNTNYASSSESEDEYEYI
jgi:hypothetical protein